MSDQIESLYTDLAKRADLYGIAVREKKLDGEVPGEFDGPTITLNRDYDASERAFYLAHSIGSIAQWSIEPGESHHAVTELRQAKKSKATDPDRLERALTAYLSFENKTWEYAVWLLKQIDQSQFVKPFTNFGRADMEAMRRFHSSGKAPVWRDFFAAWNREVSEGKRSVSPFNARPIPNFRAIKIPKQEIVQEDDQQA